MYYNLVYLSIIIVFIYSIYAQFKVKSIVKKYQRVPINSNLTGAEIAKKVLNTASISIPIEITQGKLSDHYDPIKKILRLSPQIHNSRSIAAAGIAAHEAGHAIQDAKKYKPLVLRTIAYPVAGFSSYGGPIMFFVGFFFQIPSLTYIGIIFYAVAVLFYLITLPVEFNASSRAKEILFNYGFITGEEKEGVKKVLNAAAMTYVAAAMMALLQLLRYAMLANRRR